MILPFFTDVDGEIHHEKRYERYPSYVVVGTMPERDDASAADLHEADRPQRDQHAQPLHGQSRWPVGDEDPSRAVADALDQASIGMEVLA